MTRAQLRSLPAGTLIQFVRENQSLGRVWEVRNRSEWPHGDIGSYVFALSGSMPGLISIDDAERYILVRRYPEDIDIPEGL